MTRDVLIFWPLLSVFVAISWTPCFFGGWFSGLHWQADKPLPPVGTEIRACDYDMWVVSMQCYQSAGDVYKLYLASHPRLKSILWTDMLKHSLLLGSLTVTHNLKLSWSAGPFFFYNCLLNSSEAILHL